MRKNLKKIFNSKVFVFVLGGLLFSVVSVYAVTYFPSNQVTYDNKTSKLNSTNVQGAIDELYTTCSSAVSSGKYMYYAVTKYSGETPRHGTLYRCNADGSSCIEVAETINGENINSVAATNDYMYYTVTEYSVGRPDHGTLYRCNADGSSCIEVAETIYGENINSVAATNDYMYYTVTEYSVGRPNHGTLYRCNADGSSCIEVAETIYGENINSVG